MKIKKISEEITYKEEATTHILEVNGKKIKVYEHSKDSIDRYSSPEYDVDIDETDLKTLTDIEQEALGEDLNSHIALKEGEETEVDEELNPEQIRNAETAEEARKLAISYQEWASEQSLSYGEIIEWQSIFNELAVKFNLTEEFKENGII